MERNNRKKEQELEARLAIIRQREQEIEELRKQQTSPMKRIQGTKSSVKCVTNFIVAVSIIGGGREGWQRVRGLYYMPL